MTQMAIERRTFMQALGGGLVAAGSLAGAPERPPAYRGPNVIIVRFGGGVRRRETIDPDHTYAPFLSKQLVRRGALFPRMEIAALENTKTSHGEGTLNILTGKYDHYGDIEGKFLGSRFEAKVPTLFEQLRKAYDIPSQQALIVNGEDRTDEEFYSFSNHHLFGVDYRSNVLSLYRFKTYLLRRQLSEGKIAEPDTPKKQRELARLEAIDYRTGGSDQQAPEIEQFWERWRAYYGDSGLVHPRGDRLLTELTLRALRELRPRLLMVNYNDPDYVHWGNPSHYTRGVSIIDDGLERLVSFVDADDYYRDNTVFAIVPDCGRDDSPFASVPFQHHFNSRSAHDIWALFFGPGVARNTVVDEPADQICVAPTLGRLMGVPTELAEGHPLEEVFA